MATPADEVRDFFKNEYWPHKGRCHQPMAVVQGVGGDSKRAEQGLNDLLQQGLIERGPEAGFCLTDAGLRAIGALP